MAHSKIEIQDLLDIIQEMGPLLCRDSAGFRDKHEEMKNLAIKGIMYGDLQGVRAKFAARLAWEAPRIAAMATKLPITIG